MIEAVPRLRVRPVNRAAIVASGAYVIHWMIAQRRTRWNFALQHAAWHAEQLGKPLLVFEALRIGHRWANDRLHRFVLDGMQDNAERLDAVGVRYLPWVERAVDAGEGLLAHLAARACVVVTDEYARAIRTSADPRRIMECGPATAAGGGADSQLPAHVVGQENPRMEREPARGLGDHDCAQ